jgi:hypothetical protein
MSPPFQWCVIVDGKKKNQIENFRRAGYNIGRKRSEERKNRKLEKSFIECNQFLFFKGIDSLSQQGSGRTISAEGTISTWLYVNYLRTCRNVCRI